MNKLIPAVPAVLWHYTCLDHGHPGIYGSGRLRPGGDGMIWLTDLDRPNPDAMGLTAVSIECNRSAARYRVDDTTQVVSWMWFRATVEPFIVDALEGMPGALPRHWFVTGLPELQAVYDPL